MAIGTNSSSDAQHALRTELRTYYTQLLVETTYDSSVISTLPIEILRVNSSKCISHLRQLHDKAIAKYRSCGMIEIDVSYQRIIKIVDTATQNILYRLKCDGEKTNPALA